MDKPNVYLIFIDKDNRITYQFLWNNLVLSKCDLFYKYAYVYSNSKIILEQKVKMQMYYSDFVVILVHKNFKFSVE